MVSGLLVGLALLGVLFTQAARWALSGAGARRAAAQADLAAESGMSYAAARLFQATDRFPGKPRFGQADWTTTIRQPTAGNRGDDWYYRAYDQDDGSTLADTLPSGTSLPVDWLDPLLATARKVSYAHGETVLDDSDGNDRLDVWSGRLRGGTGLFRLRIEPGSGGKFPLNVATIYRDRLKETLNHLGAVLGVKRRGPFIVNGKEIWWSDLGARVMDAMPASGYRDLAELEQVLGSEDLRRVRRFLTTAPCVTEEDWGTGTMKDIVNPGLEFDSVPERILEACLRYRMTNVNTALSLRDFPDRNGDDVVNADDLEGTDPYTGLESWKYPRVVILHPQEACSLAPALAHLRLERGGIQSPGELLRELDRRKSDFFPFPPGHPYMRDKTDLVRDCPYFAEAIQNAKVQMAFYAVGNFLEMPESLTPMGISSYDIDRFVRWEGTGYYPGPGRQNDVPTPGVDRIYFLAPPPYSGDAPFDGAGMTNDRTTLPFRWILGEPVAFDIRSESGTMRGSASASREGTVRVGERLWLYTQEDFANMLAYKADWGNGGPGNDGLRRAARGITIKGVPGFSRSSDPDNDLEVLTVPNYPHEVHDPWLQASGDYKSTYEGEVQGGVALARKVHAERSGALLEASYSYLPPPPPPQRVPDHSITEECEVKKMTGGSCTPVEYSSFQWRQVATNDLVGKMNGFSGMCSPYSHSFSYLSRQYSQPWFFDAADPPFPHLDLDAQSYRLSPTYVPAYPTRNYRFLRRFGVSLTCTKPQDSLFAFKIADGPPLDGLLTHLEIGCEENGDWSITFMNGPMKNGEGKLWNDPEFGATATEIRKRHTHIFKGSYQQEKEPLFDTTPMKAEYNTSGAYTVTLAYWTGEYDDDEELARGHVPNDDATYPPDVGQLVLWVTGPLGGKQRVIDTQLLIGMEKMRTDDETWSEIPIRPLLWSSGKAGVPGEPQAEMFYKGSEPIAADEFLDRRRDHLVEWKECTDVILFDPGEGGDGEAFHDQQCARGLFCTTGVYMSPRYILPEPADVVRIDWEGIVPREIWDTCVANGENPLQVYPRFTLEDGSTVSPGCLTLKETYPGEPQMYAMPVGRSLDYPQKMKAFEFEVHFDCSALNKPLMTTPLLRDIRLTMRLPRPVWSAAGAWRGRYGDAPPLQDQ